MEPKVHLSRCGSKGCGSGVPVKTEDSTRLALRNGRHGLNLPVPGLVFVRQT